MSEEVASAVPAKQGQEMSIWEVLPPPSLILTGNFVCTPLKDFNCTNIRGCPSTVLCTVPMRQKSQYSVDSQLRAQLTKQPASKLF